ncbi:MAG: FkbM family methyltransferase [Desulfobaccales bacterium]
MPNEMMQPRSAARLLEKIVFGPINAILAFFIEKTRFSKRIFDFYGRILPTPQQIVRGVPIKVIMPLNEVGVYNTFKDWEEREPEILDWIDAFETGCTFFDVGASFGTETLYAALKADGPDKIIAFDLALESSFNLAYNISINNIQKVDQYYLALSNGFGLHSFQEPSQYHFIKGRNKYDMVAYNTLSISLDQFVNMTQLYPDYIKIDVDGAEENLILGMIETVQNPKLRSVAIEVSDESEPAITSFFKNAGFIIEFERNWTEEGGSGFKNIIFVRK